MAVSLRNVSTVLAEVHTHLVYFPSTDTVSFPNDYDPNTFTNQFRPDDSEAARDAQFENLINSRGLIPHELGTEGPQGPPGMDGDGSVSSGLLLPTSGTEAGDIFILLASDATNTEGLYYRNEANDTWILDTGAIYTLDSNEDGRNVDLVITGSNRTEQRIQFTAGSHITLEAGTDEIIINSSSDPFTTHRPL